MSTGKILEKGRKAAGLTLREAGEKVGISPSQLSQIETDKVVNPPDPAAMVQFSDAYCDRNILTEYCSACPIRKRIIIKKFPPLNKIVQGVHAAMIKVLDKLSAADDAMQPLLRKLLIPGIMHDPDYPEIRNEGILRLLDVKRGAEILLDQFIENGVITADELRALMEEQQRRCEQRGYHEPEAK